MNTIDSSVPSLTYPTASRFSGGPTSRLIVLVPADLEYSTATRRISELAVATGRHIQLLSVCKDMTKEPSLRRQLIIMSALVGDSRIFTEAKVELGASWVNAVERNYQTGDIIVCFAEQRDGLLHKPLNQILEANLDAPVYILFGFYPQNSSRLNLLSLIPLWAGLISIIAGAFLLQSRIMSISRDWEQTILLILLVMAEFWLIWAWNNLFN